MRPRLSEQMCVRGPLAGWQRGSWVGESLGILSCTVQGCSSYPTIYLFSFPQSQHDAPWDKPGPGSLALGARVPGAVASACSQRKPVDGERVPSVQGSLCTDFSPISLPLGCGVPA